MQMNIISMVSFFNRKRCPQFYYVYEKYLNKHWSYKIPLYSWFCLINSPSPQLMEVFFRQKWRLKQDI